MCSVAKNQYRLKKAGFLKFVIQFNQETTDKWDMFCKSFKGDKISFFYSQMLSQKVSVSLKMMNNSQSWPWMRWDEIWSDETIALQRHNKSYQWSFGLQRI